MIKTRRYTLANEIKVIWWWTSQARFWSWILHLYYPTFRPSHHKSWPRINLAQNEQAYEMIMFKWNDNRRPLISYLHYQNLQNFFLQFPSFDHPAVPLLQSNENRAKVFFREAHREIFKVSTIELSLEMLMTELNIWISNIRKPIIRIRRTICDRLPNKSIFVGLSRLWKRSHFVLCNIHSN